MRGRRSACQAVRRRVAVAALAAMCGLGSVHPARAAIWEDGWPVVRLMKPKTFDGAGFSVQIAQYLLRARGYSLKVDGTFGPQSQEATRRFQRSHGLKATGILRALTWRKLIVPLRQGSRGDAVRAVQLVLHDFNSKLPIDGVFGAQTKREVQSWQRDSNLKPDGVVGPQTWRSLLIDIYD